MAVDIVADVDDDITIAAHFIDGPISKAGHKFGHFYGD